MPQACKYWQQGNCKFGDSCRFEHSGNLSVLPTENRFAAFSNQPKIPSNLSSGTGQNQASSSESTINYDRQTIINDLTVEKPQWILSAYSPGRHSAAQLFGGYPREQSFEEIRIFHYMASKDPQQAQQAISEVDKLVRVSEQQIQHTIQNIDGAINYLREAEKQHPNRIDICRASEHGNTPVISEVFKNPFSSNATKKENHMPSENHLLASQQTSNVVSAFGKPSAPAFTSSTAAAGVFGQPSALGQRVNIGASTKPTFGAPSQPIGIFGKAFSNSAINSFANPTPNPFSLANNSTSVGLVKPSSNPFGHTTNPPTNSLAKPGLNQFGQASNSTSHGFNKPSSNPFGQTSNISSSIQFPKSGPFGNTESSNSTSFPSFGTPSFGSQTQQKSSEPNITNQFNSISIPADSSYNGISNASSGNSNLFGNSNEGSVFQSHSLLNGNKATDRPNFPQQASFVNPEGTQRFHTNVNSQASNNPELSNGSSKIHPTVNTNLSNGVSQPTKSFKGKPIKYQNGNPGYINHDGSWERIWFFEGKPNFTADAKMPPETIYDDITMKAYAYARQNKKFENGLIPTLPPREEWCGFEL